MCSSTARISAVLGYKTAHLPRIRGNVWRLGEPSGTHEELRAEHEPSARVKKEAANAHESKSRTGSLNLVQNSSQIQ